MLKGIFFDLYNTLIITGETTPSVWLEAFYSCLKNYGLSLPIEQFADECSGFFSSPEPVSADKSLTVYEKRISALCNTLGVKIDVRGIRHTASYTVEMTNRNCYLDEHCHSVLSKLQKRYILALITNFDHFPYIKSVLKSLDIDKYFSSVIISGEAGVKKPAFAIFHLALHKTALNPEDVIFVGDSLHDDVSGALSAGIKPVLILRNIKTDRYTSTFRDDFGSLNGNPVPHGIVTIDNLQELIPLAASM